MTATGPTAIDLAAWVGKYYRDPKQFVRDMWNVEPYAWQDEIMDELAKGTRRIAVPTGHGVGKTACAAWVNIWFILTRFPAKAVVTAPSKATLEDGLMAEIKMWIGRMPPAVAAWLEVKAERVVLARAPESVFLTARTSRAENPDALQGIHADYALLTLDEGSGIPDEVFAAGQGSMSAATAQTLMLGNPVRATGYFAEAITTGKDVVWYTRVVSCLEVLDKHPNAPAREFIEEMKLLYGEDSNVYRSRVLGQLPTSDDDVIIPLDMIQSAYDRDVQLSQTAPTFWGLDVARLGRNESALAKRKGMVLLEPVQKFFGLDTMQLCGQISAMWAGTPEKERPYEILIDGIGLGAGVVDRLRELGLPAIGINVAERKAMGEAYFNLKAELWWTARAWFSGLMCKIPKDADLVKHLSCVKPDRHSDGRLLVEPKEKTLRRIGRGEQRRLDDADAFILTFAGQAVAAAYGSERTNTRAPLRRGRLCIA